jgi:drug/metabolite transporter (DMT)-like permease
MLAYLCTAWGFSFLLIAIALNSFPPLTLVFLRLIVGATMLYALMHWQGLSLPRELRWWSYFAVLSFLGNLLPFLLISWAQVHIASGQVGLLMALMPISTMVLAHFFVAHERLTARRIIGVIAGFVGVLVLVGGDVVSGLGDVSLVAQLAVVTATFAYAVNTVYAKRLPPISGLVMATGSLIVSTLLILPFTLLIDQPWLLQVSAGSWAAVIALGLFSTGLGTWVYFVVVSDCGPNFLSLSNYIIPAISFAAGAILLGELVNPSQFIGMLAICLGIAISRPKKRVIAV